LGVLGCVFVELTENVNLWHRFYSKLVYINRLEFLTEHVRKGQVDIPEFVMEHDKELEARPLMDYGFEADPLPNLHGMPLDPAFRSSAFKSHLQLQSSSTIAFHLFPLQIFYFP